MQIFIGNTAAKEWHDAPVLDPNGQLQTHPETGALLTERKSRRLDGSRITTVTIDVGTEDGQYSRSDMLRAISGPGGIWERESHEKPVFVYVPDSKATQDLLAEDFGCASGVPDDWDGPAITDAAAEQAASLASAAAGNVAATPVDATTALAEPDAGTAVAQ